MPDARLVAIADPAIQREDWQGWDAELFTDAREAITDSRIEAVLICSTTDSHAPLIEAAAAERKHIFCEKPIDLDLARARRAVQAAEAAGVKLQIGFNRRFDPTFQRVKQALDRGEIGHIHMVKIVSRDPEPPDPGYIHRSGGMFRDMTIHDFDMVRYLSGSAARELNAFGAVRVDPEFERAGDVDTSVVTIRLESGALAMIENCRRSASGYDQRVEVLGSEGAVEALNEAPVQVLLRDGQGIRATNPHFFFLGRYQRSFVAEIESFVSCILDDSEPLASGPDGLAALEMAQAAQESLESRQPVSLE